MRFNRFASLAGLALLVSVPLSDVQSYSAEGKPEIEKRVQETEKPKIDETKTSQAYFNKFRGLLDKKGKKVSLKYTESIRWEMVYNIYSDPKSYQDKYKIKFESIDKEELKKYSGFFPWIDAERLDYADRVLIQQTKFIHDIMKSRY